MGASAAVAAPFAVRSSLDLVIAEEHYRSVGLNAVMIMKDAFDANLIGRATEIPAPNLPPATPSGMARALNPPQGRAVDAAAPLPAAPCGSAAILASPGGHAVDLTPDPAPTAPTGGKARGS